MVIVVVATTEEEVAGVRARLGEPDVGAVHVAAPSDARRLVLAAVDDEREAERLASALRAEGELELYSDTAAEAPEEVLATIADLDFSA